MSNRQLLREWIPLVYDSKLIKESREKNEGKLMLQGVIQRANQKNHNKRIYPREVLMREISNYDKAIRENRAIGELDHPDTSSISLEKVSHVVKEVWWEGDEVKGRIEILPTPAGRIAETLLESGITIGISSRGVGSVEPNHEGFDIVQPDFQIICWDLVSEPSTAGAYLYAEGKSILEVPKFSKADRIYRALNDVLWR